MVKQLTHCLRQVLAVLFVAGLVATLGCGESQQVQQQAAAGNNTQPALPPEPPPPPAPPPVDWDARLDEAQAKLQADEFDAARELLSAIEEEDDALSEPQQQRLRGLQDTLAEQLRIRNDQRREKLLADAVQRLEEGDLEAATRALDDVLAAVPTQQQRERAGELLGAIEANRRTRRELMTQMRLLSGGDRANVRAARSRLLADGDVALPMLLDALHSDNPVLVANALEVLRVFNNPQRVVPAMVSVLENPAQAEVWPAAIREIERLSYPGAGPRLLALARQIQPSAASRATARGFLGGVAPAALHHSGELPCQQVAVLDALAVCNDPPQSTLLELLPLVFQDGPWLAAALRAINRAVLEHNQTDLAALRNLPGDTDLDTAQRLAELPQRLEQIITAAGEGPSQQRDAAMTLAIVTRQKEAATLPIAAVSRCSYSSEEAPSSAATDGQWNVVEVKHMWQYPAGKRPLIVLDLGEVRTVAAIRIWNYNVPGQTHRGWKDVDIFVSETQSLLTPVAHGLVPPAPGRVDVGDYSTTLSVPFVRGRYVKIEPRSVWRDDGVAGVTEIQVLGF